MILSLLLTRISKQPLGIFSVNVKIELLFTLIILLTLRLLAVFQENPVIMTAFLISNAVSEKKKIKISKNLSYLLGINSLPQNLDMILFASPEYQIINVLICFSLIMNAYAL